MPLGKKHDIRRDAVPVVRITKWLKFQFSLKAWPDSFVRNCGIAAYNSKYVLNKI